LNKQTEEDVKRLLENFKENMDEFIKLLEREFEAKFRKSN